ncbi:bifunctional diguanylate cyclase/phosphodiesterase [Deinococcus sp. YIM 134068]|uniref:putative bifunctional diguanylate cyclase/phosphodiesterase n=1 Tax=Deinococcus lichenicola TaxID=3118910 RepID=UPI002F9334A3
MPTRTNFTLDGREPEPSALPAVKGKLYRLYLPIVICLALVTVALAFPQPSPERTIGLGAIVVWALTYVAFVLKRTPLRWLEQLVLLNGMSCFLSFQACELFFTDVYSRSHLFSVMAPLIYVWSFVTLGTRRGMVASLTFYGLSVALGVTALVLSRFTSVALNPDLNGMLHLQFYVLSPLYIGLMYGAATLLDAQTVARLGEVTRQAYTDPLTGLPNRLRFGEALEEMLAHAERTGERFALLFFDLDNFKMVNDVLGHAAGDEFLRDLAGRWRGQVRAGDLLARISGDEFAMIVRSRGGAEEVLGVAERLIHAARIPFYAGGQTHLVTASAGVSLYPEHGRDASELLSRADLAMYQAKASRRGIVLFQPALTAERERRLTVQQYLRGALARQEFTLHYQPIHDLGSRRLVGLEALLRWQTPALGPVSPAEFVPIAEEAGLIVEIGTWVLREACAQSRTWRAAGLTPPAVSVNVSPAQFERPDFAEWVLATLRDHHLPASALSLELTERGTLHPAACEHLAALRAHGLHVALDDFGIEYSSLARLHELPISGLKIDRCFTQALGTAGGGPQSGAQTVAHTIIALAQALNLRVVAEGVETDEQVAELLAPDCHTAQGYLLGRPVAPEALTALLLAECERPSLVG